VSLLPQALPLPVQLVPALLAQSTFLGLKWGAWLVLSATHPDCIITAHEAALETFLQHQATTNSMWHLTVTKSVTTNQQAGD
jgi:hypothetical protein